MPSYFPGIGNTNPFRLRAPLSMPQRAAPATIGPPGSQPLSQQMTPQEQMGALAPAMPSLGGGGGGGGGEPPAGGGGNDQESNSEQLFRRFPGVGFYSHGGAQNRNVTNRYREPQEGMNTQEQQAYRRQQEINNKVNAGPSQRDMQQAMRRYQDMYPGGPLPSQQELADMWREAQRRAYNL